MRERPVSVLILGILNIGFGLLELVLVFLSKMFEGFLSGTSGPALNPAMSKAQIVWNYISTDPTYVGWHRLSDMLDYGAIAALVASGIGLLLLQNWSRLAAFGYSIYTMLSALVNLGVIGLVTARLLHDAHQEVTGGNVVLIVGAAVVGAIGTFIYPVILIYFLTRPKAVAACKELPPVR